MNLEGWLRVARQRSSSNVFSDFILEEMKALTDIKPKSHSCFEKQDCGLIVGKLLSSLASVKNYSSLFIRQ